MSIFDANRKARSSKTVVDNLNLSLENMSRVIRYGNNYYCGESSFLESKQDGLDCNAISVKFNDNGVDRRIIYRLNGEKIEKSEDGGTHYTVITSSDTHIQHMKFRVFGTSDSGKQPYVITVIKGYVERSLQYNLHFLYKPQYHKGKEKLAYDEKN